MVTSYVPDVGDMVMTDFDPKVGLEPAKRRPAFGANRSALRSDQRPRHCLSAHEQAKPHPFALPVIVDQVEGSVLVDRLKSIDWAGRKAKLQSKAEPSLVGKVRQLCRGSARASLSDIVFLLS
jgi:mRNA-degrading endonuclease toxin of MazEF toxin-antitoxin module